MEFKDHKLQELIKILDSYNSVSELAGKLQADYKEISEIFENQSHQLENTNLQLAEALKTNSRLSAYLNNILECLNAGVIVFGIDGCIKLFNKAAERLTGISRNDSLGNVYLKVFSSDEHLSTYSLLSGLETKVHGEKWFGERPVGYSATRMLDEDGNFTGVIEILYDITAEKKLRETISRVSAFEAISEMAETVAHRVRNPLASIIGFSDLLQRDFPEDHASSGIAKNISRGARELNRIITDILNYIRKTEPEYRNLDIIKFIRETVDFLKNEPYAEKIRIEFETEFESISYRFDPLLFRQMFVNIARNAYQAMEPEGGILNIRLEKTGDPALKIVFSDTGGGFPQEDAGKLFKPFYTTFPQGTGLGLPMVKRIVDFHNGAVSASIADSGGAAIIVELPI